jgi:4-hydroxy-3-methylbut-2-enyl diphosphate reductase IspH
VNRTIAIILLFTACAVGQNANKQCLIVRDGVNHRVRNAAVFGLLTGGIGLVGGLALSNTSYERIDAIGDVPFKTKYSGSELKKYSKSGVHIVLVGKDEGAPATATACGAPQAVAQVAPAPVSVQELAAAPSATNVTPAMQTASPQSEFVATGDGVSLGEASRIARQKTACLKLAVDNPSIVCK